MNKFSCWFDKDCRSNGNKFIIKGVYHNIMMGPKWFLKIEDVALLVLEVLSSFSVSHVG
jgi:hypothetical protein